MSLRRSARAGTTITLRARIFDDLGDAAQASGVSVDIYEPDGASPYETGSPTYWADGIYEYDFAIPNTGPDGIWNDNWQGWLNQQLLSGVFFFEVSASGVISSLPGQLNINNIVSVTVHSGILASDGSSLEEDYNFSFLTTVSPAYTNATKVMVEAGGAFPNITDDLLYLAILEASLEADHLTFNVNNLNNPLYQHARREWTTCRAAAVLATNAKSQGTAKSKKLGDFSVEYDLAALDDLLDRIAACLKKWGAQLEAGGYMKQTPVGVIKGELDPDRPRIGRMWRSTADGVVTRRIPVGNIKVRESGQRRWTKGFRGRW